jgi:hypothetical protein
MILVGGANFCGSECARRCVCATCDGNGKAYPFVVTIEGRLNFSPNGMHCVKCIKKMNETSNAPIAVPDLLSRLAAYV